MRRFFTLLLSAFLLIGLSGCESSEEKIIHIDVAKKFPSKELLLQDFMDIEYIPLETNDSFIISGNIQAVGKHYIVASNRDGEIFIFDRQGKAVTRFNHLGQGPEEYSFLSNIVLDEEKEELLVNTLQSMIIYDMYGNFKRRFNHSEGTSRMYVFNYDKDNLICYDTSIYALYGQKNNDKAYYSIISKQNGEVINDIYIPFDIVRFPGVISDSGVVVMSLCPIVPCNDGFVLFETSSDTIYTYKPQRQELVPFIVNNASLDEYHVSMGIITNRYYFMDAVEMKYDFSTGRGFSRTHLMYDKQEDRVFETSVYNGDFIENHPVDVMSHPINTGDIAGYITLEAYQLTEAYEEDGLRGSLKDIAAKLNDDDNIVVGILKYKK